VVIKFVYIIKNAITVKNKFVVYILRTDKNTLYTGYTNDLKKRLTKHKSGTGAKYLRRFASFELVYREELPTLSLALRREWQIKKLTKLQKEVLVKQAAVPQAVSKRPNQCSDKRGIRHIQAIKAE
jgi:putative endonuclease